MDEEVPLHGFDEGELGLVTGVLVFRARIKKQKVVNEAFYWFIYGYIILTTACHDAPER